MRKVWICCRFIDAMNLIYKLTDITKNLYITREKSTESLYISLNIVSFCRHFAVLIALTLTYFSGHAWKYKFSFKEMCHIAKLNINDSVQ